MRRVLKWMLRGALALLAAGLLLTGWMLLGLPSRSTVRDLALTLPSETSVMRQRDREAEAAGRKPRRLQKTVPLRSISKNLIHAVLSAEDPKFFGHEGIDWDAVKESIETNLEAGRYARGGSTITQQLAKNLFFSTQKSLIRKGREAIVATWMERDLPKKRIIEIYLNVIEWGDGVYGCEAAARRYYGVSCAALDVNQAAGLAAMIPSPRRINPRTNRNLHTRATRRILRLMRWAGYLRRDIRDMGNEPDRIVPDPIVPDETEPEPREEDDPPPFTPTPTPTPDPEGGETGGEQTPVRVPESTPEGSGSPTPTPAPTQPQGEGESTAFGSMALNVVESGT